MHILYTEIGLFREEGDVLSLLSDYRFFKEGEGVDVILRFFNKVISNQKNIYSKQNNAINVSGGDLWVGSHTSYWLQKQPDYVQMKEKINFSKKLSLMTVSSVSHWKVKASRSVWKWLDAWLRWPSLDRLCESFTAANWCVCDDWSLMNVWRCVWVVNCQM